jgi:hypothetical protein
MSTVTESLSSSAGPVLPNSPASQRLMVRTGENGAGAFLRANGYPISDRYLDNICAPLVNEGPQPDLYWGRSPLFLSETLLAWAEAKAKRQLEAAMAKAERLRASRDAALDRRAKREASVA